MTKTLHGQGATKERLEKSNIEKRIRETTSGGIPTSFGHQDTEHCMLDKMLKLGVIEEDQKDAGYHLRGLYYTFTTTGNWPMDGKGGHSGAEVDENGDIMLTPRDRAEIAYNAAMRSVSVIDRPLIKSVCTEDRWEPSDDKMIRSVQNGLDAMIKHFEG